MINTIINAHFLLLFTQLKSFSDRVKVFESLQSNEDVTDFVIIAIEKVIETTMSNVPTKVRSMKLLHKFFKLELTLLEL